MIDHQILRTVGGEELVVVSRSTFDALVAAAEAAEDAADVAAYDAAKAVGDTPMTPAQTGAFLIRSGFLRSVRKARGMTQTELSEATGVAQGFLSDVEAGRKAPSPKTLGKIAKALGIPEEQFV